MNKLLKWVLIVVISFGFTHHSYCQKTLSNTLKLKQVLQQLEAKHNVTFSFEDKVIDHVFVTKINLKLPLQKVLHALQNQTQLTFTILNQRYITIQKPSVKSLSHTIQQLDEVLVKNYLAKGIVKTLNSEVQINTESYQILPGLIAPDVLQIALNLPGVLSVDERVSNLNIRGGTNDQNLVLYKGIRMYQTGHFFGLISAFNPYLTEQINVSKNGTSAKYGNGVSGVINIKNNNLLDANLKAGLGVNMLSVDGFAKLPITEHTELQISARRSITDIINSPTYKAYFNRAFKNSETNITNKPFSSTNEQFHFYDVNAKFLFKIDNSSKLHFNIVNLFNTIDYELVNNNTQQTEDNNTLSQLSFGISANYSKAWQNNLNLSAEAYYTNYALDANNYNLSNNQQFIQENVVADYGLRADVSKKIHNNLKLNTGYQFNEVGVYNLEDVNTPEFRSFIKEIIRTHALYAETQWTSTNKNTHLQFGVRTNYFEKFKTFKIEPRLSINHTFLKHFNVEFLGEFKSQSLTQVIDYNQDFFGIEQRRWQLANNNTIPIITSKQAALGLNYNNKGLLISAEAYYKKVNDISSRSQGFLNQFQFTNAIGTYTITGIDVLLNQRFKNLSTWLSYSWSKNNYTFNTLNNGKSFANNLDLRHVANASITYKLNRLNVGAALNWHSGRPYTMPSAMQSPATPNIDYKAPNSSRLPAYSRTDISASYHFNLTKNTKAEVAASVWNVFNQNNIVNRYYLQTNTTIEEVDIEALNFTPNFSFRVKF